MPAIAFDSDPQQEGVDMSALALDSETELIAPGKLAPRPACFSWALNSESGVIHHSHGPSSLLSQADTIVGANIAFDMAVILNAYPELGETVFNLYRDEKVIDVQLSEKLIDIARGVLGRRSYSLDALHQHYGFPELDKSTWRMRYGEFIDVPLEQWPAGAVKYAKDDAVATLRVYQAQRQYADWLEDERRQPGAAFALHLMSCVGMRTDPVEVAKVTQETEKEIATAQVICEAAGLVVKGKRKQAPAKQRLLERYDELGFEVPLTETGIKLIDHRRGRVQNLEYLPAKEIWAEGLEKYVKTDETACKASGDPALIAYAKLGSAKTLRTKLETLAKGVHTPLQTRYDCLKETGRTSSSAPGEPLVGLNIQNQDRDDRTRRCFIPTPGYYLCSIDFNIAELVAWSQVQLWACGESEMAKVLNADMDPHLDFASKYLLAEGEISYESALKRKKEGDHLIREARQIAKIYNFGLPGGLGDKTGHKYLISNEVNVSFERACEARRAWYKRWKPEPYFAWIKEQCQHGAGTAVQFLSGRVRGLCTFSAMANTFFQGLTADAAKSCLLPVTRECYLESEQSWLFGSRPVAFIHDELLLEVPIECAHEAAYRARDIMIQCFREWTPDVKVGAEPALMTRWTKTAEAKFDSNGRLIPWDL